MAKITTDKKLIEELLTRGIEKVFPSREAVEKILTSGKQLRVYLGVDPTSPHLHFGHAMSILILRRLQRLGHEVIFLIGDFTAQIGDPTDKAAARVPLTKKEVEENLKTFRKQAGRLIKFANKFLGVGTSGAKVKYNSSWLGKMDFEDVVRLAQNFTVQQMIERDMFEERIKNQKPVGLHEFLYPLMQGYDSVAMNVDMEVGGNDQTFNMLAGRDLQKIYNNKEKFVIATKLLVDPKTGKKLMSKSEGNTINLDDTPADIFGKTMALDDNSMLVFAEYSTEMPMARIHSLEKKIKEGMNPRDAKLEVASAAVELIYGKDAAEKAQKEFLGIFSEKKLAGLETIHFDSEMTAQDIVSQVLDSSNAQARRNIEQGGFEVNGSKITDPRKKIELKEGDIVRVGKKHIVEARIK